MECTDMERRILDMWPKFEDGTYVWFGDTYSDAGRDDEEVVAVEFRKRHASLVGLEGFYTRLSPGERVKQPEPKDSWERLEEDATMLPWSYCDKHGLVVDRSDGESAPTIETFAIDLVRRAKALAEKEAGQ